MGITRNAAASVGQVLASAGILFVFYRVILDTLDSERLGIWSVVLAAASASRLGELGISNSVTRFVAKYRARGDDAAVRDILQTASISIAAILTVAICVSYPLLRALFPHLFPAGALNEALALLPYALLSLVITSVALVSQSGLDGCQRYDRRALLVTSAQLAFLATAVWLVPRYGLLGVAWAQLGQSVILLLAGWICMRRLVPGLPMVPLRWSRTSFREMLSYGLQFQFSAIALMLFEPLTKALMGRFGGLSAAGYYEMAQQFVTRARLLIVSANQVLIPVAASLNERDPDRLKRVYSCNLELLLVVVAPLYALLAAWAPLLSEVWVGRLEPQFVFFVNVLALAWALNTLSNPAYYLQLGTGRIFWNTAGHVWMGIANAGLGLLLGPAFGAEGIIWGMAAALVTGSTLVVFSFHRDHRLSWAVFRSREALILLLGSAAMYLAADYAYHELVTAPAAQRYAICLALPFVILGPFLWVQARRLLVQVRLLRALTSGAR